MQSPASKLSEIFPVHQQTAGQRLFSIGATTLEYVDGPPWFVTVGGPRTASVRIDSDRAGRFEWQCDCEADAEFGTCKHAWAAVLAVAAGGRAQPDTGGGRPAQARADDRQLERLRALQRLQTRPPIRHLAERISQVHYLLMVPASCDSYAVHIAPVARQRLASGKWSVPKPLFDWGRPTVPLGKADVEFLHRLAPFGADQRYARDVEEYEVPAEVADVLLPELAASGRLIATYAMLPRASRDGERVPVASQVQGPVILEARCIVEGGRTALTVSPADGAEWSAEKRLPIGGRMLLVGDRLLRWQPAVGHAPEVVLDLLRNGAIELPAAHAAQLQELGVDTAAAPAAVAPVPQLHLERALTETNSGQRVRGKLRFRYGAAVVDADRVEPTITIDGVEHARDEATEADWLDGFERLGGALHMHGSEPVASLPARNLPSHVRSLLLAGFEVFAQKLRVRSEGTPAVRVSSGVDWFEVQGGVRFGDQEVPFPALLAALREKSEFVRLGDGSYGMLPEKGLAFVENLLTAARREGDVLRFGANQGWLLDAMLAASDAGEVSCDAAFARVREQAGREVTVKPLSPPRGFGAELRPYQRTGLGWFAFLQELGVGGCLADDMGLGKTVQVLALLEQRRRKRPAPGPSLVVAPRSLVFHWQREAAAFAPKLRVLAFVGAGRFQTWAASAADGFRDHDLVLTTYGTLRVDASRLHDVEWDYVVLDEAQAIKNERSQASKAVRLCKARHRLALSGTPIENHLGELWALFEFLNPGMLGRSSVFRKLIEQGRTAGGEAFTTSLRRAVRPFMLRRTKAEVLPDLPAKIEQTLDCELPQAQRQAYDELARHYRATLLGEISADAIPDDQRFMVLEALLRLRQASCHPGLLDGARADETCAKFDVLWPMLEELREEGHKALVFSQFPSFLRLLQRRLHDAGIEHAWLDGSTTRRQEEVERFESDPACQLFLISLKAGGHGLNLTAATYVFLLDPWWNPAVEAQAIDRVYRIGQTRTVHAYRLVCTDTVEQRVAELQQRKRALADAVLGDDRSLLQELSARDLAFLLE